MEPGMSMSVSTTRMSGAAERTRIASSRQSLPGPDPAPSAMSTAQHADQEVVFDDQQNGFAS